MEIIRYPHKKNLQRDTSITIGNFDGVHLGHQTLIQETVDHAMAHGLQSVIVSMQPLPLQFFKGKLGVEILSSFRLKQRLLAAMGVDVFCNLNFNHQLAAMSAKEFFDEVLLNGLQAKHIVVGDDFKFGANREGDFELLQKLANDQQISLTQVSSVAVAQHRVSSTLIRQSLNNGDFKQVKNFLGRDFNLLGRVAHGQKLGRTLGYPTLNLELKAGAFSLHGVYVVTVVIEGLTHQAVASVGFNPSVGGNAKRVEVYVLDFDQQIYGQWVEVLFYKKLRNEVEFDTLNELTTAIEKDVSETRAYFADLEGEPV